MRRHSITVVLAGCMALPVAAIAAERAEAQHERALAEWAEQVFRGWIPDRPALPPRVREPVAGAPASPRGDAGSGLFVGIDDPAATTWFIDPADGSASPGFAGSDVWGAAHVRVDVDQYLIFLVEGSELAVSSNGQPAAACCTMSLDGSNPSSFTGAAFDPGAGRLLFTRNLAPESIFSLEYSETLCTANPICTVTELVPTDEGPRDLGGLAFSPDDQVLYATDDTSGQLVAVESDGSLTPVAAYPNGESDIDGLAYHDGKLYLVTDEPGSFYVYDIEAATYGDPLPNPWKTSEIFAGAAFVLPLVTDIVFRNGFESVAP